jgi:hypothetical protein
MHELTWLAPVSVGIAFGLFVSAFGPAVHAPLAPGEEIDLFVMPVIKEAIASNPRLDVRGRAVESLRGYRRIWGRP